MDTSDMEFPILRILVIGVGGMGCAMLNGLYREQVWGMQTLSISIPTRQG